MLLAKEARTNINPANAAVRSNKKSYKGPTEHSTKHE
jgi:hypothetical protein